MNHLYAVPASVFVAAQAAKVVDTTITAWRLAMAVGESKAAAANEEAVSSAVDMELAA